MNWFHSRVELVLAAVLLVVELLGLLLGVVLGLLAVDKVQALGLDELVDLEAGGGRQHLLGQAVLDGLALLALVLLPEAHALEGGRGADELVGHLGLVGLAVVDLVASVLCLSCGRLSVVCMQECFQRVGWMENIRGVKED